MLSLYLLRGSYTTSAGSCYRYRPMPVYRAIAEIAAQLEAELFHDEAQERAHLDYVLGEFGLPGVRPEWAAGIYYRKKIADGRIDDPDLPDFLLMDRRGRALDILRAVKQQQRDEWEDANGPNPDPHRDGRSLDDLGLASRPPAPSADLGGLAAFVDKRSAKQRRVLELLYGQRATYEAAGGELGLSRSAVQSFQRQAVQMLRKALVAELAPDADPAEPLRCLICRGESFYLLPGEKANPAHHGNEARPRWPRGLRVPADLAPAPLRCRRDDAYRVPGFTPRRAPDDVEAARRNARADLTAMERWAEAGGVAVPSGPTPVMRRPSEVDMVEDHGVTHRSLANPPLDTRDDWRTPTWTENEGPAGLAALMLAPHDDRDVGLHPTSELGRQVRAGLRGGSPGGKVLPLFTRGR